MAWSKDHMCSEISASLIDQLMAADAAAHAGFVAIEVPYDAPSAYVNCTPPAGYLNTWISAARRHGLHVWLRAHWNSWEGDYGARPLSYATSPAIPYESGGGVGAVTSGADTTSYLARTYQWILSNRGLLQSGDIFTPAAEPANGGILGYSGCSVCQFPSKAEYNRWLRDSMTLDAAAVPQGVKVGYWGVTCDLDTLEKATATQMGVIVTDCYMQNPSDLVAHLTLLHNTFGVPIIVGEWGDIWDGGREPVMANEVAAVMQAVSQLPWVVGFNYWRDIGESGGEGIVDPSTMQLNQAGVVAQGWFRGLR